LKFLETSQHFNPENMLSYFFSPESTLLFEEKAILLSRIGQHEDALDIYVHKLKDNNMAENYCIKNYNPDKEKNRDVFLNLIHVFLKEPANVKAALSLLDKHSSKIDLAQALNYLPHTTPISDLFKIFELVLRDHSATRRNNQVVRSLLKSENIQVQEDLVKSRARMIKIGDDRVCQVCNKRLGNSVFANYPNGTTVHYICCKDKNVCPVTGTRFN